MSTGEAAAASVVSLAREQGLRISVAESLTGGLLADAIVSVPGASAVFSGAVIAYDTALKTSLLGVDEGLLRASGPVDPEVARQMARGVRLACAVPRGGGTAVEADVGLATTGVAGPDPDPQTGQPAGTVWVALSAPGAERAERVEHCEGGRGEVRRRAVEAALRLVESHLRGEDRKLESE